MDALTKLTQQMLADMGQSSVPERQTDRVENALLSEYRGLGREPTSLRGRSETALELYRRFAESDKIACERLQRFVPLWDTPGHERLAAVYRVVNDYRARHGRLPPLVAIRYAEKLFKEFFEIFYQALVTNDLDFSSQFSAFIDGCDHEEGRPAGSSRSKIIGLISEGNAEGAYWVLRDLQEHRCEAWDMRKARTLLGMEYDEDAKMGMSQVIADTVNGMFSWSKRRVHVGAVYAHLDDVVESYRRGAFNEIIDKIGYEAYR